MNELPLKGPGNRSHSKIPFLFKSCLLRFASLSRYISSQSLGSNCDVFDGSLELSSFAQPRHLILFCRLPSKRHIHAMRLQALLITVK